MNDIDKKDLQDVAGGFSPENPCFPPFPFPDPDYPDSPIVVFPEPLPSPIDPVPFVPGI